MHDDAFQIASYVDALWESGEPATYQLMEMESICDETDRIRRKIAYEDRALVALRKFRTWEH